jgi:hypothetical protein
MDQGGSNEQGGSKARLKGWQLALLIVYNLALAIILTGALIYLSAPGSFLGASLYRRSDGFLCVLRRSPHRVITF